MVQYAKVTRLLDDNKAVIEVQRESACMHDCSRCGGCISPDKRFISIADNKLGASVDDGVLVETSTSSFLGITFIVYILPLLLFFIGYLFLGKLLPISNGLNGFIGFLIGAVICFHLNRKMKKKDDLIRIVQII